MFRSTIGIGYGNPDDRWKVRLEFRITPNADTPWQIEASCILGSTPKRRSVVI